MLCFRVFTVQKKMHPKSLTGQLRLKPKLHFCAGVHRIRHRPSIQPASDTNAQHSCTILAVAMPKKPVGILKRNAHTQKSADQLHKRKKRRVSVAADEYTPAPSTVGKDFVLSHRQPSQQRQQHFWTCQSEVDRQAAACISKILAADTSKRNGKTIKSLTLAPHIKAKKAVYAITCQTLQRAYTVITATICSISHAAVRKHLYVLQICLSFSSYSARQAC